MNRNIFYGTKHSDNHIGAEHIQLGGRGADHLTYIGNGHGFLFGGRGADTLEGNERTVDYLTGGAGRDTFIFNGAFYGIDTVVDFQPGIDKFSGLSGELCVYDSATGVLSSLTADGTTIVPVLHLATGLHITEADFIA